MTEPKIGHDGTGLTTEQLRRRTERQMAEVSNGHRKTSRVTKCGYCEDFDRCRLEGVCWRDSLDGA